MCRDSEGQLAVLGDCSLTMLHTAGSLLVAAQLARVVVLLHRFRRLPLPLLLTHEKYTTHQKTSSTRLYYWFVQYK